MIEGLYHSRRKLANGKFRYYYYTRKQHPRTQFWTCDGLKVRQPYPKEFVRAYVDAIKAEKAAHDDYTAFERLADDWAGTLTAKTREGYASYIKKVREKFRKLPVSAMADPKFRGVVIKWQGELAASSARTADMCVFVVNQISKHAVDLGTISENRTDRIKNKYRAPDDKTPIPQADIAAFLDGANPTEADIFVGATHVPLRRNDLALLSWSQFKGDHFDLSEVRTSKRNQIAIIPLTAEGQAHFEDMKRRQAQSKKGLGLRVFTGERGNPMRPDTLGHKINDRFKDLGLDHTLHRTRNTYATRLCVAGFSNAEIALIMGWSETDVEAMKKIYVDRNAVVLSMIHRLNQNKH